MASLYWCRYIFENLSMLATEKCTKKISSIRFLQDCSCFWKDIFKEDFRDNLWKENLLKDFEIDPIKPPLLAQVLIKSVLMEVY